ncbi:MAG: thioredoxin domain-containing protein [Pirellula sp.]
MISKPTVLCFGSVCLFCQIGLAWEDNRLAKESSPYLLQHAHNPVDWYPWGDEAIERAQKENKLIFLSVGYAACHWCHVMERESFEDKEIAKFLNANFICIKVDREERPDIDQIYMTAIQIMSSRGGWPMTVLMTPDTKPIFGGSYFPARDGDRPNLPGFLTIIRRATQLWTDDQANMKAQADRIADALKTAMSTSDTIPTGTEIDRDACRRVLQETQQRLATAFDALHGGFSYTDSNPNRPKFPEPSNLIFLLERSKRTSLPMEVRDAASGMLTKTLDAMIAGGIYDHLGGGFHRYSTDRYWRIPHFEKMLYDNGQLAQLYANAFEATGRFEYRIIAEGTCDFVIRELTAPGGAFYASLDADSEGEEGKFYRWERNELARLKSSIKTFALFSEVYGLSAAPNFEDKYYAPQPGKTLTQIAQDKRQTLDALTASLVDARKTFFEIRAQRVRPPTDVKVLTSWNGLMIAGLADSGRILKRKDYIDAASTSAEFVLEKLKTPDGRLLRSHANGESKLQGYLDDYAFLAHGLLRLHLATQDNRWLEQAIELTRTEMQFFRNEASGGFYYTATDHPQLIVRFQDPIDGVIPSGNSVTASNLHYMTYTAKRTEFEEPLRRVLLSSLSMLERNPRAAAWMSAQIGNWLDHQ